jgi:hypothetical protein
LPEAARSALSPDLPRAPEFASCAPGDSLVVAGLAGLTAFVVPAVPEAAGLPEATCFAFGSALVGFAGVAGLPDFDGLAALATLTVLPGFVGIPGFADVAGFTLPTGFATRVRPLPVSAAAASSIPFFTAMLLP